jgi:hypothetical protein
MILFGEHYTARILTLYFLQGFVSSRRCAAGREVKVVTPSYNFLLGLGMIWERTPVVKLPVRSHRINCRESTETPVSCCGVCGPALVALADGLGACQPRQGSTYDGLTRQGFAS